MKCRPTHQDWTAREILRELCADVATQAGIVRDIGRSLNKEQRGQLDVLIRVARRTAVVIADDMPQPVGAVADPLAVAMEA